MALLLLSGGAVRAAEPWRAGDALGLPPWLSLSLQHRTRFEFLDDQFRPAFPGDQQLLVLRTLFHGRLEPVEWLALGAEVQDSRAELTSAGEFIDTGSVNAAELLQAYLELQSSALPGGGRHRLRGGRITLDLGSRRFVARNRFRNTINAFTGLDWSWSHPDGWNAQLFWTLPVRRLPSSPPRLRENDTVFDEERLELQLWGVFMGAALPWQLRGELFYFGLHESNTPQRPNRNRRLHTPGLRLLRPAQPGRLDYQLESAFQLGRSRLSSGPTQDLDHFAHFHHLELGYSFGLPGQPRLAALYDYASGDESPNDLSNERFDTLFGARRFDFGPTGIYGPFARSNLHSPGLRVQLRPHPTLGTTVAFRGYWLASKKDAWTTTGLQDPSGKSGRFLGAQIELRLRWEPLPGNLRLEGGYAHLFPGGFVNDVPGSLGQGDSDYFYTQIVLGL